MVSASFDDTGALIEVRALSTDSARNYHVRLSPDGQQVAFDSDRDGERAVYVGGSDGTDVRKVSGDGFAAVPTWSPDGGRLAFVRAELGRARVWNLWLLHLASGEMRRLTFLSRRADVGRVVVSRRQPNRLQPRDIPARA